MTNREAHEQATNRKLPPSYFRFNNLDPDAPFTGSLGDKVYKDGVEVSKKK
jgi:hypothetical protein